MNNVMCWSFMLLAARDIPIRRFTNPLNARYFHSWQGYQPGAVELTQTERVLAACYDLKLTAVLTRR